MTLHAQLLAAKLQEAHTLPHGHEIYDVAGQTIFPHYGQAAGMMVSHYSAYIVVPNPHANIWLGSELKFTLAEIHEATRDENACAIYVNGKVREALKRMVPFDSDGGSMPHNG